MADEELEKVIQECRLQFLAVLESGHTPDLAYFFAKVPRESQSRLLEVFQEIEKQTNQNNKGQSNSEKSRGSSENSLVGQILDRWEMAYERGEDLSPEELCASTPRLLNHVREKIDALRSLIAPLDISQGDSSVPTAKDPMVQEVAASSGFCQLKLLAQGGLGVVYVAHDVQLNRDVAVKFIQPRLTNNEFSRQQFMVEAEITGRLEHPGVVPLYAAGQTGEGQPFYVMRLIHGNTLDAAIERLYQAGISPTQGSQRLEFRDLLQHFAAVCKTIAFAHNRGVLHRDLKPSNVMLGRYGETLVVDWGLAIPIGRDARARASGERSLIPGSGSSLGDSANGPVGTPAYMSPEQVEGSAALTPASDIFSLGAMLYKLLTGNAPYQKGDVLSILEQAKNADFEFPRAFNRNVSRSLEAVCLKAMSFQPADRYETAMDLARDVERWLADDPVSMLPDSLLDRCGRWFRRNRSAAKLLALATTAVLAISLFSAFGFQRLARHEHQALIAAQSAREQSLRMAAQFAAKTVAGEIDLRWRILETEASDKDIRELLAQHDPLAPDRERMKQLQAWLDGRFIEHKEVTRPASWLIADSIGRQLARSPAADTIGEMFQFRDYYHGQGKDLDPTLAVDIPPLRQVHRSMVFNSQASGQDLVAFSVPIWSGKPGSDERRVLGVLVMTVAAGEFHILKTALSEDQIAVLVDTRPDFISGTERRGRVLQHPRISNQSGPTNAENDWRLPEDRVDQLVSLRQFRLQGSTSDEQEMAVPSWTNHYLDPLHQDPNQQWLAAFEPVFVDSRPDDDARDSGWVVIIQTLIPND